jgi:hypothetical protein
MLAQCYIIFICIEITKKTECWRIKTLSGKTGLPIVIVGLALTSPLNNYLIHYGYISTYSLFDKVILPTLNLPQ